MTPAPRRLLTTGQVAERLARSRAWFLARRQDLVARHAFPAPVPGCGMRWDPAALDAWLDAQLPAEARGGVEGELIRRAMALAGEAAPTAD